MARYEIRVDRLEDVEEILHEDIPLPLSFRSILHLEVDPIRVDRLDEDQIRVDRLEDEEETIQQDIPLPLHMARYKIRVDHLEDVEESLLQDIPLPLHMTR
jgi:hypothetical protein